MIKHLFKLIWNKKKENFLLISEILVSFMVMFAVVTLIVHFYNNYSKPMGFDYENVWIVNMDTPFQSKDKDTLTMNHEALKNALRSMPKVKYVSYTSANTPFSNSMMTTGLSDKNKNIHVHTYNAEDEYLSVLDMKLVSGRWYSPADRAVAIKSIVINKAAAQELFGTIDVVGKVLGKKDENRMKIIGVVEDFKDKGNFLAPDPSIYTRIDTGNIRGINSLLIRVSPDADAAFESRVYKLIAGTQKDANLEIKHLTELRVAKNKEIIIPMVILLVVSGFLIFNVALGLFGVLWYNISKRKGEIGLRRAIGASAASVSWQLVGEALVLATFSLIVGTFFAIQFPLLNVFDLEASEYMTAIVLSNFFIYTLVLICALYPGRQAAAIHPAVALHED